MYELMILKFLLKQKHVKVTTIFPKTLVMGTLALPAIPLPDKWIKLKYSSTDMETKGQLMTTATPTSSSSSSAPEGPFYKITLGELDGGIRTLMDVPQNKFSGVKM